MPAHRTSNAAKESAGTLKPSRTRNEVGGQALTEWPPAPEGFIGAEQDAWGRLGAALLPTGTVCAADLILAAYVARVMVRADIAMSDPGSKLTSVTSLLRFLADLLRQLGMSPAARERVQRLPSGPAEDDEDELAEFGA